MKNTGLCARIVLALLILCSRGANGQLSGKFYAQSCPQALSIVKDAIDETVCKEKRMGAALIHLFFHDCFVNGCDGSILLDDTSTFIGEKNAKGNGNSTRGYEVIDTIKSRLEAVCSGVVSCADIVAIAARDSVVALGGPKWTVPLGRRDSITANLTGANSNFPHAIYDLNALISVFEAQGLSAKDMIALSGAHTIGQARCRTFRSHIYNETNINSVYARSVKANCPSSGGDDNFSPFDVVTPYVFDNNYYKNLKRQRGLLHSDQALFNGGTSDAQVIAYSKSQKTFFNDFAAAMVNMGNISPLTGTNGE
ncbi:hypothetical protein KI387_023134, partial [Taxus chinensis]